MKTGAGGANTGNIAPAGNSSDIEIITGVGGNSSDATQAAGDSGRILIKTSNPGRNTAGGTDGYGGNILIQSEGAVASYARNSIWIATILTNQNENSPKIP